MSDILLISSNPLLVKIVERTCAQAGRGQCQALPWAEAQGLELSRCSIVILDEAELPKGELLAMVGTISKTSRVLVIVPHSTEGWLEKLKEHGAADVGEPSSVARLLSKALQD